MDSWKHQRQGYQRQNIHALDITARYINVWSIDALDIDAGNINAQYINAVDIDAKKNIYTLNIIANNIRALKINTNSVLTRTGVLICEKLITRSLAFTWPDSKKPKSPPEGAKEICDWKGWPPILREQLKMFFRLKMESTKFAPTRTPAHLRSSGFRATSRRAHASGSKGFPND